VFLNCSTHYGRHTAHHQELKNCNCSLWFYIRFLFAAAMVSAIAAAGNQKTYVKPEAAITVFELLMMGGVLPETCWAIKKHWNNKFYYTVASCWFFLWDLYYDAWTHENQVHWRIFLQIILWLWRCILTNKFQAINNWHISFLFVNYVFTLKIICDG